ncbi:SRPBCC domain-containing protein [Sphingobium sp. AN558]|uniref:SRPBCC domain-containing protein n=1 Tax=Sphingobium sp. AN558 TaxID=3133442 RepID=UPI0030C43521
MSGEAYELSVTCFIAAPRDVVWTVWTQRTAEWFSPAPWKTEMIAQDLRAGGRTALRMTGPNGEDTGPLEGVILEVVPNERIVTTDAWRVGWVPQKPFMTTIWSFADEGEGTRYNATVRHWDAEAKASHEAMGFHPGWDIVAAQFKALCEESVGRD